MYFSDQPHQNFITHCNDNTFVFKLSTKAPWNPFIHISSEMCHGALRNYLHLHAACQHLIIYLLTLRPATGNLA